MVSGAGEEVRKKFARNFFLGRKKDRSSNFLLFFKKMKTIKKIFAAILLAAIVPAAGASAFFGFGGGNDGEGQDERPRFELTEENFSKIVERHKMRKQMDAIRAKIDAAVEASDFDAFKTAHEEMETFRSENEGNFGFRNGKGRERKGGGRGGKHPAGNCRLAE